MFDFGRKHGLFLHYGGIKANGAAKELCATNINTLDSRFFRISLIRTLVYPGSESGGLTNEFKQRAPRIFLEMPDRWLATYVTPCFVGY